LALDEESSQTAAGKGNDPSPSPPRQSGARLVCRSSPGRTKARASEWSSPRRSSAGTNRSSSASRASRRCPGMTKSTSACTIRELQRTATRCRIAEEQEYKGREQERYELLQWHTPAVKGARQQGAAAAARAAGKRAQQPRPWSAGSAQGALVGGACASRQPMQRPTTAGGATGSSNFARNLNDVLTYAKENLQDTGGKTVAEQERANALGVVTLFATRLKRQTSFGRNSQAFAASQSSFLAASLRKGPSEQSTTAEPAPGRMTLCDMRLERVP